MKFHYAGKFNGDETSLPQREPPQGAVPFKEPQSMQRLAIGLNVAAFLVCIVLELLDFWIFGHFTFSFLGCLLALLAMIPHEFLHALCFRDEVRFYENLKQGMLFVVGTEDMSKARFVFMSLLPNLVFGLIPFVIYCFFPTVEILGTMGIIGLCGGVGDYMNVFNALTQVPKGGLIYMSGMHSYWHLPLR